MNLDSETGISIMKISEHLDSGPILSQDKIKINQNIDSLILSKLLSQIGAKSLISALEKCNDGMKPEDIQTQIYTVGKENGYKENLRDWFKLIYEVVFGDENGPRIGFFISFFGVNETKQLIKDKLN